MPDPRPDTARPLLAVTMGDPCGIGAEVIAGALARDEPWRVCRPLVVGDAGLLRRHAGRARAVVAVTVPQDLPDDDRVLPVWEPIAVDIGALRPGQVCREGGRAAVAWVCAAVDLALAGDVAGLVTGPLNKEAMHLTGYPWAGHTELLAARTGARSVRMLLAAERLKVVHVTTHVALRDVPGRLDAERVDDTIRLGGQALVDLGCPRPRIGVAGLNPHAGESGLFGDEDEAVLGPAVARARAAGWDAVGPLPADTLFQRAHAGQFDLVVAMYHDQGHIPIKLVAFAEAVNITLGLPIVRTSVDHGTAFDRAWKGIANPESMLEAIHVAVRMLSARAD